MYFNDVHILIYVAIAVAGFFIGKFVNWCNYRLPEYKRVFSKDICKIKELTFNGEKISATDEKLITINGQSYRKID